MVFGSQNQEVRQKRNRSQGKKVIKSCEIQ